MESTQKPTKPKQMSWTKDMIIALISAANQAGLPKAAHGTRKEKLNAIVDLLSPQAAFVGGVKPTQVAQKIDKVVKDFSKSFSQRANTSGGNWTALEEECYKFVIAKAESNTEKELNTKRKLEEEAQKCETAERLGLREKAPQEKPARSPIFGATTEDSDGDSDDYDYPTDDETVDQSMRIAQSYGKFMAVIANNGWPSIGAPLRSNLGLGPEPKKNKKKNKTKKPKLPKPSEPDDDMSAIYTALEEGAKARASVQGAMLTTLQEMNSTLKQAVGGAPSKNTASASTALEVFELL